MGRLQAALAAVRAEDGNRVRRPWVVTDRRTGRAVLAFETETGAVVAARVFGLNYGPRAGQNAGASRRAPPRRRAGRTRAGRR